MASKSKPGINWGDDAASGLRKIIEKALAGGSKKKAEQVVRVTKQAKKVAKKQGKTAQVASMEAMRKQGRKAGAAASIREQNLRNATMQMEKRDTIAKKTKQYNKADVEAAKGQGVYRSTTGKTKVVGADRAAQGRRTSGAMASKLKKEAAMEKQLRDAMNKAKGAAAKRAARQELYAFLKKTGRG